MDCCLLVYLCVAGVPVDRKRFVNVGNNNKGLSYGIVVVVDIYWITSTS